MTPVAFGYESGRSVSAGAKSGGPGGLLPARRPPGNALRMAHPPYLPRE